MTTMPTRSLYYGFVSYPDLVDAIRRNLYKIPRDTELVVGIPRSGMVPAYLIALYLNIPVQDLPAFLENRAPGHGKTRRPAFEVNAPLSCNKIFLVDDSYRHGNAMKSAVASIREAGFTGEIVTCAAVILPAAQNGVDVSFIEMPWPHLFEWNMVHTARIEDACLDFDGVLCFDPTKEEDDDGPLYAKFLEEAKPLFIPTVVVGNIVSARLEKYRAVTERWLQKHGVRYRQLHLVNLPTLEERTATNAHIELKSKIYLESNAGIFIESSDEQAREIAQKTGKPVLSIESMSVHDGTGVYLRNLVVLRKARSGSTRFKRFVKNKIPPTILARLKNIRRRLRR